MHEERNYTQLTTEFVEALRSDNPGLPIAVVLIGSVARGTAASTSDLDLLVVSPEPARRQPRADRLHVQAMTERDFRQRLAAGDDFAAWCVRYGVPIVRSDAWLAIANSPEASVWPDWRQEIPHALRRLALASQLLEVGDTVASGEETLYAISHTSRGLLLKEGVFPLSRPEMIHQLYAAGHRSLGDLLKQLVYEPADRRLFKRSQAYVKKLLIHLDRISYRHLSAEKRRIRKAKQRRAPARAHA